MRAWARSVVARIDSHVCVCPGAPRREREAGGRPGQKWPAAEKEKAGRQAEGAHGEKLLARGRTCDPSVPYGYTYTVRVQDAP